MRATRVGDARRRRGIPYEASPRRQTVPSQRRACEPEHPRGVQVAQVAQGDLHSLLGIPSVDGSASLPHGGFYGSPAFWQSPGRYEMLYMAAQCRMRKS